jgi:hypothetical protein
VIYVAVGVLVVAAVSFVPFIVPISGDYTNQITSVYQRLGFSIVSPFTRTTVAGINAYVGFVRGNQTLFEITVFPRSSHADAQSFQQTAVQQFESQGFVTIKSSAEMWAGELNNTVVGVYASSGGDSPTGSPAVVLMQSHLTPSATASTVSSSASGRRSS